MLAVLLLPGFGVGGGGHIRIFWLLPYQLGILEPGSRDFGTRLLNLESKSTLVGCESALFQTRRAQDADPEKSHIPNVPSCIRYLEIT